MLRRRAVLLGLLLACVGLWASFKLLAKLYEEEPNYTLIEEGIYVGGFVSKPPPGTQFILNLCELRDSYPCESVQEPIRDAEPAPSIEWLSRMVELVRARRREGLTIFIHCQNGVSRSGMVITAFVMDEHGWSRDEALANIRAKRPGIRPNPAFMDLLAEWEQRPR
jgi:hypothetical protein